MRTSRSLIKAWRVGEDTHRIHVVYHPYAGDRPRQIAFSILIGMKQYVLAFTLQWAWIGWPVLVKVVDYNTAKGAEEAS